MAGKLDEAAADAGTAFLGDDAHARFLAGYDWASTGVGPIEGWPSELRTAVGLALPTDTPTAVWWGPDYRVIPNEAFLPILTERGRAPGATFDAIWGRAASSIRDRFDGVAQSRRGRLWQDARQELLRDGRLTETYWTYSITPILARDGAVLGLYNSSREVTERVLAARRGALLVGLDDVLAATENVDALIDAAVALIGRSLEVKRVGLAEIDQAAHILTIRRCWEAPGVPDVRGDYPIGSWGAITDELARGSTVVIDDYSTDPRTADPATQARYRAMNLAAGIVVPIIERGAYVGGVFVQQDVARAWSSHEVELTVAATRRLWQAITRVRANLTLRESERRHRLIFEQAGDLMFTTNLENRLVVCNPATARALGYATGEMIGQRVDRYMAPGEFERTDPVLRGGLGRGGTTRYEVDVLDRDAHRLRWEVGASLARDRDGRVVGVHAIARDVTERRAFESRRELLINELNHRVKNTLSLVQALAHQSFRSGEEPHLAQREFVGRLGTLAAAHDLLTREQWEGVTLRELVEAAAATLARDRIAADGPAVKVTPKAAVAVAMALHELGTNAIKYGALSTAAGRVAVNWSYDTERLRIGWRESHGPAVSVPERRGFGVKMIERALASDLDASVRVDFARTGVTCAIDAPRRGNML